MLISMVMPTGDRHRWVPQAINCFLSQTFVDSELVILDDGEKACSSLVPHHPRIRYIYQNPFGRRKATGAKRNLVNSMTYGEIIGHLDDDDWSAPERIERQLAFMEQSAVPVVGYHSLLYWRESDKVGFVYSDPMLRPHCTGTSLFYRKSFWERHNFQDVQVGEDFQFCMHASRYHELASEDANGMIVARAHDANSCVPRFGVGVFKAVPMDRFPPAFFVDT